MRKSTWSTALTRSVWDLPSEVGFAFNPAIPLDGVEVAVVGAGIAGLAVAIQLARDGRKVVVLDRHGLGAGESLRTTAHLASALDDRFTQLIRWHGVEGAALARASHAAAVDWIEQHVGGDRCGFRRVPGYLFTADGKGAGLDEEQEAAEAAGILATLLERGIPGLPDLGPALRFPGQARVDMGALMSSLASEAITLGVAFHLGEVTGVEGGASCRLTMAQGTSFSAGAVVIATNVPFHEPVAIHTKQAAYRSYAIAGRIRSGALPDALIWDNANPYHYVRLLDDEEEQHPLVIIGGEDHKVGQADDPQTYLRLRDWAQDRLGLGIDVVRSWSGQIIEPADGLAFIGPDAGGMKNVYVVTGDSGNGVTHGVIGGILIADLVAGRRNDWAALYDPRRRVRHAGGWLKENANVALRYGDWLLPGDVADIEELAPGQGAIVRRGMRRLAVFRNAEGGLETFSARCPHLGCSVSWSHVEKSWDCPCHGSRFDGRTGAVLNGPATSPLERIVRDEDGNPRSVS